jgi:hypothetical protein
LEDEFAEEEASCLKNMASSPELPTEFRRGSSRREGWGLRRFLAFVEERIDGDFESLGQFFESFDGGTASPFSTRER